MARTAAILATVLVALGCAIILIGARVSETRDAVPTAEQLSSLADTPSAAAPEIAATVEPDPARQVAGSAVAAPSRMVAPKVVAPPEVAIADLEREAPRDPLSKLSLALPPPPKPPGRWDGTSFFRPVATESAKFESMQRTVTIAGTTSLSPDETCTSDGVDWPCGMRARAAFRLWLRGRALVCQLPPGSDAVLIDARCRLGKQDVGAWLVSNGWARAMPDGPYGDAGQRARASHLGIFGPAPDASALSSVPPAAAPAFAEQPILVE